MAEIRNLKDPQTGVTIYPVTKANCVYDENGKNINELFVGYENGVVVEPQINELLEKIYPIGSIYMSVNNVSPASFLGGTWERIQDRFLLGAGSSYSAGSTGGEASHTLTVDEMPSHNHGLKGKGEGNQEDTIEARANWGEWISAGTTLSTGGSQAHNNMPPYLAVYIFKRIA